jgi:flagellar biogenesis protein FliO
MRGKEMTDLSDFIQTLRSRMESPMDSAMVSSTSDVASANRKIPMVANGDASAVSVLSLLIRGAQSMRKLASAILQALRLKFKRVRGLSRIRVIEKITLAPRHSLMIVDADGQRLLLSLVQGAQSSFFPLESRRASAQNSRTSHHRGERLRESGKALKLRSRLARPTRRLA